MILKVSSLLTEQGSFWFILPVKQAKLLISKAESLGLYLTTQIDLHSDISKAAFRWIVCLSKKQTKAQLKNFYIYESEKVYTKAYKDLLKDFFLGYWVCRSMSTPLILLATGFNPWLIMQYVKHQTLPS